jgi:hypothetical protein
MWIFGSSKKNLTQDHGQASNDDHEYELDANGVIDPDHHDSHSGGDAESIRPGANDDSDLTNIIDDDSNDIPLEDSTIDPIEPSSPILDLNRYDDSPVQDLTPGESAMLLYTVLHDYDQSVSIHDQISLKHGFVDSWITSSRFLLDVENNGEIASVWLKKTDGEPLAFTYDPESIRSERAHGRLALNVIKLTLK